MKHPNYDIPGIPEGYEVFFRMTRKCRLETVDEADEDEDSMKDWKYDRLHNYIKQRDGKGNVYVYRIREDNTCTCERWFMKDGARYCEPGAVFNPGIEIVFQETDRESWEYDERGNCVTFITKGKDRWLNTYDAKNRVVSEKRYFSDGLLWADKGYAYNEDGTLREYYEDMLDIQNGHGDYHTMHYKKTVPEYDSTGRTVSEHSYDREGKLIGQMYWEPGGKVQISTKNQFEYWQVRSRIEHDDEGRVISDDFELNGKPQSRTEYEYRDDGSYTERRYMAIMERGNELLLREEKTFDKAGRRTAWIEYGYNSKRVYEAFYQEYDEEGNLTRTVRKTITGTKPQKEETYIVLFGTVGGFKHDRLRVKEYEIRDGKAGNVTEYKYFFPDENTVMQFSIKNGEVRFVEIYEYDSYGNLLARYSASGSGRYGKAFEYAPFVAPKGRFTKEDRDEEHHKVVS
ncbi:MAG: hypothetical protein J5738_04720 [Lachnospiraceae bacterium]|nr:hypothetical protein [Lachnospiraceae bacterium]